MINVNIEERHLSEFLLDGFLLEHNTNILTIRNEIGKQLAEIIYFEQTNEVLIMDEHRFVWCERVTDVRSVNDAGVIIDYEIMDDGFLIPKEIYVENE